MRSSSSSRTSSSSASDLASSCRRSTTTKRPKMTMSSCGKLGKYLKQQQGRLYVIRRCVVMLVCWRD
ncbi:unnamed protein product [Linum trigynum]|uniref:ROTUNDIFOLIA like 8 n=1 Tax=Linum trigynum TaxID=586398 RepID=A0AAV2G430_9ROSI